MIYFRDLLSLWRREFAAYSLSTLRSDLLAGMTVAAVALPLALAFGIASGADAAAGLVTAVLAGVLIGILGGAPYQVSGPTGAMSAILLLLAMREGLSSVWLAGAMAGLILILLGLLRMGRVVNLIPAPVITGFTSGIAILIALGQVDSAFGLPARGGESPLFALWTHLRLGDLPHFPSLCITTLVIGLMLLWPRMVKKSRVPGSLVALIVATVLANLTGWELTTIGEIPRSIVLDHGLRLQDFGLTRMGHLLVPACSIAALGAIESLLCGAVAGNATGIRLHTSLELIAQGLANFLIPFFGGVPATAAIARTSVNIRSGGVTRMAPIFHGLVLLAVVMLIAPWMSRVPLAALAGILLVTAWQMNEWKTIRFYFERRLKHAIGAFALTLLATVVLDLTQAIVIGFGFSALVFMSQVSGLHISSQELDHTRLGRDAEGFRPPSQPVKVYYTSGPLFFAAARRLFERVEAETSADAILILSMRGVSLIDATGVQVLRELWQRQLAGGGDMLLTGMQPRVEHLLVRTGLREELGDARVFWSADRAILSLHMPLGEPPQVEETPAPAEDPLAWQVADRSGPSRGEAV